MNLGWLGAWKVAELFSEISTHNSVLQYAPKVAKDYTSHHRRIAKKVARRAEINMALGRRSKIPPLRNLFVQGMLHSPLKTKVAELFTMRGLENWWI